MCPFVMFCFCLICCVYFTVNKCCLNKKMIVCDNTCYFCNIARILLLIVPNAPLKANLNNLHIVTIFFPLTEIQMNYLISMYLNMHQFSLNEGLKKVIIFAVICLSKVRKLTTICIMQLEYHTLEPFCI